MKKLILNIFTSIKLTAFILLLGGCTTLNMGNGIAECIAGKEYNFYVFITSDGQGNYLPRGSLLEKDTTLYLGASSKLEDLVFNLVVKNEDGSDAPVPADYKIDINFNAPEEIDKSLAVPNCTPEKWPENKQEYTKDKGDKKIKIKKSDFKNNECFKYDVTVTVGAQTILIDPWIIIKK